MSRMTDCRETWYRLLNWDKGQSPAERLAAILLRFEGFKSLDPSHPLGGKDGLKDMICHANGITWNGAVYFPRGQQQFKVIKQKFMHDFQGLKKNNTRGFAFITNQELRLAERTELTEYCKPYDVEIYHLERLISFFNTPACYGVRMEFLDIEMSKEEQLAYFAHYDCRIAKMEDLLSRLSIDNELFKTIHQIEDNDDYPRSLDEICDAIDEFYDKIWFDRHQMLKYRVERGKTEVKEEIWRSALEAAEKVIQKYGEANLGPYSDFEWGMLNGKLSALRWVCGYEWDMLDT